MTITRHKPLARGGPLARSRMKERRTGDQRRTRHPMPLPSREHKHEPPQDESHLGMPVAFGPQAELCRATACCVCWARARRRDGLPLDWTQLPELEPGQRSEAHHEPPRSLRCASDDDDTIPLCHRCHQGGPYARHVENMRWSGRRMFWPHNVINPFAVRDEMRRRVRSKNDGG